MDRLPVGDTDAVSYMKADPSSYAMEAECDDEMGEATACRTAGDVPVVAESVIDGIDGNVIRAQEDDDGMTVAILTPNEYILVYEDAGEDGMGLEDGETAESVKAEIGSDGDAPQVGYKAVPGKEDQSADDEEGDESSQGSDADGDAGSSVAADEAVDQLLPSESSPLDAIHAMYEDPQRNDRILQSPEGGNVLVHVSSRKYAYATDRRPYHASYRSYRWYRRFYRTTGYEQDENAYADSDTIPSSYGTYVGETSVELPDGGSRSSRTDYEEHASDVRQSRLLERIGFSSDSDGNGTNG